MVSLTKVVNIICDGEFGAKSLKGNYFNSYRQLISTYLQDYFLYLPPPPTLPHTPLDC